MHERVGGTNRLADGIALALDRNDPHEALRHVAEFVLDVDAATPRRREELLSSRPGPTGRPAWDALLAGVTELLAHRHGLRVPPWTVEPDRFLDRWWFFSDRPGMAVSAFTAAPAALANRGVFVHAAALESV